MTKESRWEPPSGTDTETLKFYMANYHSGPTSRPDGTGNGEGKIRCSHLLVKHKDSRRPSSWKESEITRSKEEAIEILRGHETRINSGEVSLGDLAMSESDCSSARKKGDLYVHPLTFVGLLPCGINMILVASLDVERCRRSSRTLPLLYSPAKSAVSWTRLQVSISLNGKLEVLLGNTSE